MSPLQSIERKAATAANTNVYHLEAAAQMNVTLAMIVAMHLIHAMILKWEHSTSSLHRRLGPCTRGKP